MSENAAHLPEGTKIAGKLRILRLLGMGGMGAVYEVEHELTKHRRALKMLHAHFRQYPNVIARFLREASAAGRIGNPHIIETFDAGELESGEPYLVMEFLEGRTLSDLLGQKGRLELAELAELIRQSCDGVQAAHEAGIIHRDLKPDNLYIVERAQKPFVKILDFGVSKFDAELTGGMGMTKEGSTLGTPFYMPPEQVRGEKDVDARADVYALGVILYECISGRRPFEADTLPHLALLIHEGNATPLAELRPELPQRFIDVVARAMASDRNQRFATARELAQALAPFVDDALGATMAEAPAPAVVVRPAAAPAPSVTVGKARTDAGALGPTMPGAAVSIAGEPAAGKRNGAGVGLVIAGAIALAAGVGFWLTRTPHAPPEPASSALVAPAVLPQNPATLAATAPSPAAAAAPSIGLAAPEPPPSATPPDKDPRAAKAPNHAGAGAAHADTTKPPSPPSPVAPPPATKTRVDQRGLANDNPFK